jgi:hypothetical protein
MRFAGQAFEDNDTRLRREYDSIPGFGVKPLQKGLQYAFPQGTKQQFFEDLNNPIKQPGVEQYIYNRHVLDANNPFPIT